MALPAIRTRNFLAALFAVSVVIAFAVYWPSLKVGYLSDDWDYAYLSQHTTFVESIPFIWSIDELGSGGGNYRPLPSILAVLVWKPLFTQPEYLHAIAIALHAGVAFLTGLLAYVLFKRRSIAVLSAIIFAIHPLNVSVATWLSAVNASLSLIPLLIALIIYTYNKEYSATRVALITGLLILSFLSKEYALLFPVCAFLIDVILQRRSPWKLLLWFLVLGIGYMAVRLTVLGGLGGYEDGNAASLHTMVDVKGLETFLALPIYYLTNFYNRMVVPTWFGVSASVIIATTVAIGVYCAAVLKQRMLYILLLLGALVYVGNALGWNLADPFSPTNGHSRIIYFSTVWASIGMGYVLYAIQQWKQAVVLPAVVLVVGVFTVLVHYQQLPWLKAAEVTTHINSDIQTVLQANPNVKKISIDNLPDQTNGAFIYRNGVQEAAALMLQIHKKKLRVVTTMQPQIDLPWKVTPVLKDKPE